MTGFARGEGHLHGLGVAELADDDDIGILAKRRQIARPSVSTVSPSLRGTPSDSSETPWL